VAGLRIMFSTDLRGSGALDYPDTFHQTRSFGITP